MLGLIKSLSLDSGSAVVAILSLGLGFLWARIPSTGAAWALALGAPLFVSYSLYWFPVFMGSDASEYNPWAPLVITYWYFAGAVASCLVVLFMRSRKKIKRA